MTFYVSLGKFSGISFMAGFSTGFRVSLGWLVISAIPINIETSLAEALYYKYEADVLASLVKSKLPDDYNLIYNNKQSLNVDLNNVNQ